MVLWYSAVHTPVANLYSFFQDARLIPYTVDLSVNIFIGIKTTNIYSNNIGEIERSSIFIQIILERLRHQPQNV